MAPVAAGDLDIQIQRFAKDDITTGTDRWRAPQLKVLPQILWQAIATLLNNIENGELWPGTLTDGTIALLRKRGKNP